MLIQSVIIIHFQYHQCCIENTVEMAEILIKNGADLNARDIEGWTPLHAASACGSLAMINLLINEGANLVAVNHDDKMPVDVACDADIRYVIQQKMLEAGTVVYSLLLNILAK